MSQLIRDPFHLACALLSTKAWWEDRALVTHDAALWVCFGARFPVQL